MLANRIKRRYLRRATAIVQVAVMSTLVMGFGALAVDISAMYTAKTELQAAADAAALAGAAHLAADNDPVGQATSAITEYANMHYAFGWQIQVDQEDITFGHATYDFDTGKLSFHAGDTPTDAVRVKLRSTSGGGSGVVPRMFADIISGGDSAVEAQATAVLVPRDIAVVVDLSRSMLYDSTLRSDRIHRGDGGYSNARDIWCALNGPSEASRPYVPATSSTVDQTEYEMATGPTFGQMTTWGDPLVPGAYSVSNDPGLWLIPREGDSFATCDCTEPAVAVQLAARGYSNEEINALMGADMDSEYGSNWKNRVKVILGLYDWNSGKEDGRGDAGDANAPAPGNGNDKVGDGEVWQIVDEPDFAYRWTWDDYVYYSRGGFQRRYGLKTFVDFLNERRCYFPDPDNNYGDQYREATYDLWAAPQQPLRAVKDAVRAMRLRIEELQSPDQMSLESFCGNANSGDNSLDSCQHEQDLTTNLDLVTERCYHLQAGHYDTHTNIGGGLWRAIQELTSERARDSASKVIVLLSDGYANRYDRRQDLPGIDQLDDPEDPQDWESGGGREDQYARAMARIAARNNIRIHTVGVGYDADHSILQEIAEQISDGVFSYASGDPALYGQELAEIFAKIGGMRAAVLID